MTFLFCASGFFKGITTPDFLTLFISLKTEGLSLGSKKKFSSEYTKSSLKIDNKIATEIGCRLKI